MSLGSPLCFTPSSTSFGPHRLSRCVTCTVVNPRREMGLNRICVRRKFAESFLNNVLNTRQIVTEVTPANRVDQPVVVMNDVRKRIGITIPDITLPSRVISDGP